MMVPLIKDSPTIIPACDVPTLDELTRLVSETTNVPRIGAYKVGFYLGLRYGLPAVVNAIRRESLLPIIYDHQKAGTDIPDLGTNFARVCKNAGIDAVILFPLAGPETARAWIEACRAERLRVLVGGHMTHPAFLREDGGFVANGAPEEIYGLAAKLGVTDFVLPGNQPNAAAKYKKAIAEAGVTGTFYAPGFVIQGGDIKRFKQLVGGNWHAIVGSALYKAENIKEVAERLVKEFAS